MKADDLRLEEMVNFADGTLTLRGREVVIHSLHAFAQLRKDLIDSAGLEHARNILTRFGYFQGQADASVLMNNFKWDNSEELIRAGCKLHSLEGIARRRKRSRLRRAVGKISNGSKLVRLEGGAGASVHIWSIDTSCVLDISGIF